jgi:hypothetical protein
MYATQSGLLRLHGYKALLQEDKYGELSVEEARGVARWSIMRAHGRMMLDQNRIAVTPRLLL